MGDTFIKVTNNDDDTTITVNTGFIVKATRGEDDEYTTLTMMSDYDDIDVNETPEKVYSLINGVGKTSSSQSLNSNPETPPRATTTALQNDTHMQNLAKHA